MTSASIRSLPLALMASVALAGCTNPDAPTTGTSGPVSSSPQNASEPSAPPPPSASTQAPLDVQATPSEGHRVVRRAVRQLDIPHAR